MPVQTRASSTFSQPSPSSRPLDASKEHKQILVTSTQQMVPPPRSPCHMHAHTNQTGRSSTRGHGYLVVSTRHRYHPVVVIATCSPRILVSSEKRSAKHGASLRSLYTRHASTHAGPDKTFAERKNKNLINTVGNVLPNKATYTPPANPLESLRRLPSQQYIQQVDKLQREMKRMGSLSICPFLTSPCSCACGSVSQNPESPSPDHIMAHYLSTTAIEPASQKSCRLTFCHPTRI